MIIDRKKIVFSIIVFIISLLFLAIFEWLTFTNFTLFYKDSSIYRVSLLPRIFVFFIFSILIIFVPFKKFKILKALLLYLIILQTQTIYISAKNSKVDFYILGKIKIVEKSLCSKTFNEILSYQYKKIESVLSKENFSKCEDLNTIRYLKIPYFIKLEDGSSSTIGKWFDEKIFEG